MSVGLQEIDLLLGHPMIIMGIIIIVYSPVCPHCWGSHPHTAPEHFVFLQLPDSEALTREQSGNVDPLGARSRRAHWRSHNVKLEDGLWERIRVREREGGDTYSTLWECIIKQPRGSYYGRRGIDTLEVWPMFNSKSDVLGRGVTDVTRVRMGANTRFYAMIPVGFHASFT